MAERVSERHLVVNFDTLETDAHLCEMKGGRGGPRGGGRGGAGGRGGSGNPGRGGGGRGGGQGGGRGGGPGGAGGERPKKEAILDLAKYVDKRVRVKFTGGREGERFIRCLAISFES